MVSLSVMGAVKDENSTNLGLLPHSSSVFPVLFFSSLLSCFSAHDPVDISFAFSFLNFFPLLSTLGDALEDEWFSRGEWNLLRRLIYF